MKNVFPFLSLIFALATPAVADTFIVNNPVDPGTASAT